MYVRLMSVAVAVSVLAFVAAPHPRWGEELADLGKMQGQWQWPGDAAATPKRAAVDGGVLTIWEGGRKVGEWKLRLNASRSPRTFDARPLDGGEPLFGVYEFVGEELHLRWANRRDARPESAASSAALTRPALRSCEIGDPVPSPLEPHGASIRVPMPALR